MAGHGTQSLPAARERQTQWACFSRLSQTLPAIQAATCVNAGQPDPFAPSPASYDPLESTFSGFGAGSAGSTCVPRKGRMGQSVPTAIAQLLISYVFRPYIRL